jgi:hypothetical protein
MPIVGSFAGASARAYGLGAGGVGIGDFQSISTSTVGVGGIGTITFSSIPQTYTHLQIRFVARNNRANAGMGGTLTMQFNSDTGANYFTHRLYGTGSALTSDTAGGPTTYIYACDINADSVAANIFSVGIIDILDYANTNKNKTIKTMGGADLNGSGIAELISGQWRSNSAISTITLKDTNGTYNFVQNSTFALYGIKA